MPRATKQKIIRAYLSLRTSNKHKTITVGDVMKKAGYHRSSFYNHFKGIDDIEEAIRNEVRANPVVDRIRFLESLRSNDEYAIAEMLDTKRKHLEMIYSISDSMSLTFTNYSELLPFYLEAFECNENSGYVKFALAYLLGGGMLVIYLWLNHDNDLSATFMGRLLTFLDHNGPYCIFEPDERLKVFLTHKP